VVRNSSLEVKASFFIATMRIDVVTWWLNMLNQEIEESLGTKIGSFPQVSEKQQKSVKLHHLSQNHADDAREGKIVANRCARKSPHQKLTTESGNNMNLDTFFYRDGF